MSGGCGVAVLQLETKMLQICIVCVFSVGNVKTLSKSLEKQLEARGPKKPAGGVNMLVEKPTSVKNIKQDARKELKVRPAPLNRYRRLHYAKVNICDFEIYHN